MYRSYELDTTAAKKADEKSARINTTGVYIGSFKHAIARKSPVKGTEGVELHFETTDKQEARLTLWTFKGNGEPLSGFNILQAILTCLQIRGIKASSTRIELYDPASGGKTFQDVNQYLDLVGKPIGLLLQLAPEEYMKQGVLAVANKLDIYGVFQSSSNLVASEILGRVVQGEKLDKMKAALKDRPLKKLTAQPQSNSAGYGAPPSNGFDDFEDDIPF
ncbi:hypothetical protein [Chitinimonas sp. BJB300]|uniref:hypothetical protein n=1 Tax=Chitinimonas sp. BJB300 TaxID=1559339 RepID=UPI000C0EBB31|nr:hypothetical protein [Chitinimonas sp. BJB300]PHV09545.1 hypothetical protein CSQ89_21170 [Chitinimonas sp. BJB300]TSJ84605.1 hypothetical protein FG002_019410 [Chitinimonas sp. BJB300]